MTTLSPIITQESMYQITAEFSRLKDQCYLDNAGANLYPRNLLQQINDDLMNNVYMNPHTDRYTNDCMESIRTLILQHFHADPAEYTVVFTSGTTQSLKLVVESFQFTGDDKETSSNGSFVYLQDNHTSVLGLREIAEDRNADIIHISHDDFLSSLDSKIQPTKKMKQKKDGNSLFVFPAQSNFNGYKYPINDLESIKNGCLNNYIRRHLCKINCNWYILVDAASFVATNKLDLSIVKPDFLCFSFYKIFGYPTGLGALIVKNSSGHVLSQKRYFGGGTVDVVLSSEDFHVKRQGLHERFEDGTASFLSIISLRHCFDMLNKLIPKIINNDIMETISHHTFLLAKDLYNQLNSLLHPNGKKAVLLYLDTEFKDIKKQGGMVTFNLLRDDGTYIGYAEFQHMADLFNIHVRTGCFCNSGSCQRHLKATNRVMKEMYKAGHKCGDELDLVNGRPTGAVRASFAYYNTFNDVDILIAMICKCFVKIKPTKPIRVIESYNDHVQKPKPCKIEMYEEDKIIILRKQNVLDPQDNCLDSDMFLEEIAIFPIKSCGAFKVKTGWKIGETGFEYDRVWMIVNTSGICLTQKNCTKMCMIKPKLDLKQRLLVLNFKGKQPISIPINPISNNNNSNISFCQSKVCMDTVKGIDCGDEAADWISEALEISFLRLIKQSVDDSRSMKRSEQGPKFLSLSNQAQYLLINKATVRWLADHISDPQFSDDIQQLTDRFRGNLVIESDEALIEPEWERIIIGNHEFKVEGPCRRCQMICIDQHSGEKTVEPLRTISEQFAGKMRFGIYLSHVGAVDSSVDKILKLNSAVHPLVTDDENR